MPLFYFKCGGPETHQIRRILKAYDPSAVLTCPTCQAPLVRDPKPPSSNVVETLDNGFMVKKLERPADVERLIKERSEKAGRGE